MTVNFHSTCRLIPHLLSSYSLFFHVSSVSDVFMLGLFNQGPYFAYRKQLSNLLVVNKSPEKPWWGGCHRCVVPSSAREVPASSCGCIPE